MGGDGEERDGVRFTHLDEELFDGAGVPKRALVDYLDAMAERIVPVLRYRPLSTVRVRLGQEPFMQKNLPRYAPEWISRVSVWANASQREVAYALCDDRRTLLWFANQRAVEYHVTLCTVRHEGAAKRGASEERTEPDLEDVAADWAHPTHAVLDLDPPEGAPFERVVRAALLVRQVLTEAGLQGAVKTSGAKGLHVFIPLREEGVEDVAAATRALAARAERLDPDLGTTAFVREERGGRVFLDSTRAGGATVVAAYSPRARPGLPVSFPVGWDDLDRIKPTDFTVATVPTLIDGDPWVDAMPQPQKLPADLIAEGHQIPIARVAAMHAGKRRKRAAQG